MRVAEGRVAVDPCNAERMSRGAPWVWVRRGGEGCWGPGGTKGLGLGLWDGGCMGWVVTRGPLR